RVQLDTNGWADDPESNRRIGLELARQALQAATDDPTALGGAAFVLARFGGDIDAAVSLIDRSLTLNPSFALGRFWSGTLRLYAGEPDLAIGHLREVAVPKPSRSDGRSVSDLDRLRAFLCSSIR